jgi:Pyruvate/2-oxoacid:ferredoxin oxidoreductase delta subunit
MMITTDAPVKYDDPVDYGIQSFCQTCQVCVKRCPGRALIKEQVWWRGVEKNKLSYDRCRPVMARYDGCAVCIRVCPVQRYGMKLVMEHYVDTGEILGKGTHNLEGYDFGDKGYFGPGELPHFDHETFEFPHGRKEDWLFTEFKKRLRREGIPPKEEMEDFAGKVKEALDNDSATQGEG